MDELLAHQVPGHVGSRGCIGSGQGKTVVRLPRQNELLARTRPGVPVEVGKSNAPPVQVVTAYRVAIDLDVHYDRIRLLDSPNLSQLNAIAEAR